MGWGRSLKADKNSSQDLSAAPLSYTTAFARRYKLEQILFHASVAISETITVTLVSGDGANYNQVLAKHVMDGETDWNWRPTGECNMQNGDEIKIQCTNANTTGIVYTKVKTSELLK